MSWGRIELEALDRDDLLSHARRLGIARPEFMTRRELVDELVRAGSPEDNERRMARSLLGKARELVARVMDLGLHLPDAAQRLRPAPALAPEPHQPEPLATTALARVYAAQGHRDQALATLERVLARDPAHPEALRLRRELATGAVEPAAAPPASIPPTPPAPLAPVDDEVSHAAPPAGPPERDELRLEAGAGRIRISWRVKPSSFAHYRSASEHGRLVLRVVQISPAVPEPLVTTIDTEIDSFRGAWDMPWDGAPDTVCAAVGVRTPDRFQVIASAA